MSIEFQEFQVKVDVRGVGLTQEKADELISAILSREFDHHPEWGEENKASFRVPGFTARLQDPDDDGYFPGDDAY